MGRNLNGLGLTRLGVLDLTEVEKLVVLLLIEVLSELINSSDSELTTEGVDGSLGLNLIASKIVISNEVLAWLVDCKALRKLLSLKKKCEGVATIIGVMNLSDLNCIISEVVVDDEGQVVALDEETQHSSVVIEELFLGGHSATTEGFL